MLVLPDFCQNPQKSTGFWQRQPLRANIPKSTSVSIVFASHHKIPQNFKILTFDLKTTQKVQN
jgi:hypothetical protein